MKFNKKVILVTVCVIMSIGIVGFIGTKAIKNKGKDDATKFVAGYYKLIDMTMSVLEETPFTEEAFKKEEEIVSFAKGLISQCPSDIKDDFNKYIENHELYIKSMRDLNVDEMEKSGELMTEYNKKVSKKVLEIRDKLGIKPEEIEKGKLEFE